MAKSQETFNKKEKEKKRLKKRTDKQQKQEDRKSNQQGGGLESMIAYVDAYGHITDTPPDPSMKLKIDVGEIEISIPKKEDVIVDPIKKGKVDFYNSSKGFGFIKELETQEKYFVHVHSLLDDIEEGDMVTFELEKGLKGMNAVRVAKVK
jgi:cold shock CspA family protein